MRCKTLLFSHRYGVRRAFLAALVLVAFAFAYNEYIIYWQVLFLGCQWPTDNVNRPSDRMLKVMVLSDTHLLGSRHGHWFDKLRREWQQYRAFQTARALLKPDYVIILGDVTDEGKWCSDKEWTYYENRVKELFFTGENGRVDNLIVVVGNHDIGFHYDMQERKLERFNRSFGTRYLTLQHARVKKIVGDDNDNDSNNIIFVSVNSMAMENDGCRFCAQAQRELKRMNATLECLMKKKKTKSKEIEIVSDEECTKFLTSDMIYSRPIVLIHFPLFRKSDSNCPRDVDSEFAILGRNPELRPKYDCLSLESTKQSEPYIVQLKLINMLNPRLVLNGHTHYSCYNEAHGVPEYTLASFSWRNINTPSMLLIQVDDKRHYVSKCYLPSESSVIALYSTVSLVILIYFIIFVYFKYFNRYLLLAFVYRTTKIN